MVNPALISTSVWLAVEAQHVPPMLIAQIRSAPLSVIAVLALQETELHARMLMNVR